MSNIFDKIIQEVDNFMVSRKLLTSSQTSNIWQEYRLLDESGVGISIIICKEVFHLRLYIFKHYNIHKNNMILQISYSDIAENNIDINSVVNSINVVIESAMEKHAVGF